MVKQLCAVVLVSTLIVALFSNKTDAQGCFCTAEYEPVCGSNGQTYSNACNFECVNSAAHNGRLSHTQGSCESGEQENDNVRPAAPDQNCICTMEYNPVCGSDGKTYSNFCNFECASRVGHLRRLAYTDGACESAEQENVIY